MSESYTSNTTYAEVAQRINAAARLAIITHTKPDGDGLGAMLALKRCAPDPGKIDLFVAGPIEPPLFVIAGDTPFHRATDASPGSDYDIILVVDTGARRQLEPFAEWLAEHRDRVIVIDHHSRGDDVSALRLVESNRSSVCSMIVDLLDELGWAITGGVGGAAEALYAGIATDTGWFRYDNAQAPALKRAARLLEIGVDKSRLYQIIEETHPVERLALESRALASIEFACGGGVAIQSLHPYDFDETGCTVEHLTGVVNLPMITRQVRVSILLAEIEPGFTKMSFRAKPELNGSGFVDVNQLAQRFGGGGHVHASGAKMDRPLDEARRALRDVLETDELFDSVRAAAQRS